MGKRTPKQRLFGLVLILAGIAVLIYNFYPLISEEGGWTSFGVIPFGGIALIFLGLAYIGIVLKMPSRYW